MNRPSASIANVNPEIPIAPAKYLYPQSNSVSQLFITKISSNVSNIIKTDKYQIREFISFNSFKYN